MNEREAMTHLNEIKSHLNITWEDSETDEKVLLQMLDAEAALNHILGAVIDYFKPGLQRQLYRAYMLYSWNDCINEFTSAYSKEILTLRHMYEAKGADNYA